MIYRNTYAAVAAKISIGRPLVKTHRLKEKIVVKRPTIPNRCLILATEYNMAMEITGRTDATTVITSLEKRERLF